MNYPSINDIIPAITKEERLTLFDILDKLTKVKGDNPQNNSAISGDETLLLLNNINELNQDKFSDFLRPIVLREKNRVFSINNRNCANNSSLTILIPYISKQERYELFMSVDKLLKGNISQKATECGIASRVYTQYLKKELFCWDKVPGIDNKRLKTIFHINKAKIDKSTDGQIITLKSTKKNANLITLRLNENKTKIKIDGFRIEDFIVENINGKQKIYRKNLELSDAKTLSLLNLLKDKNPNELTYYFLPPIIFRAQKQVTIFEDCLNSGVNFKKFERLYGFHQRYAAKKKELGV